MGDPKVGAFLDLCGQARTVPELWRAALAFFEARGIGMMGYCCDDVHKPDKRVAQIMQNGFPKAWERAFVKARLRHVDPVEDLLHRKAHPIYWSDVTRECDLNEAEQSFMDRLAETNPHGGLAMQVFGPQGRHAVVWLGFAAETPPLDPTKLFEMQTAAQIAHMRYCVLTADLDVPHADLSRRELEVLQWIAKGKSNTVIADILGISRHTVDTMVRRLFAKLEVNDRTTAALRGIGAGLIRSGGRTGS